MNLVIVYTSKTGHTEELAYFVRELFANKKIEAHLYQIKDFPIQDLATFDGVIIGTYTWGDGEIPDEMVELYRAFESKEVKQIVTGVIGTGDSFYLQFCGAVDSFRDMLYVQSRLAVTLKVEVALQTKDLERCNRFVEIFLGKLTAPLPHKKCLVHP